MEVEQTWGWPLVGCGASKLGRSLVGWLEGQAGEVTPGKGTVQGCQKAN